MRGRPTETGAEVRLSRLMAARRWVGSEQATGGGSVPPLAPVFKGLAMKYLLFILAVAFGLIYGFDAFLFFTSTILFLALWYWLARAAQAMIWQY